MEFNDAIMEKAERDGVKVTGLEKIPTIVQGRPLFDFTGADKDVLEKYGQDPDDIFAGEGLFNIALHPDGRVEGLKTVSRQYKVVQHDEAIWKLFESLPESFEIDKLDVHLSADGGSCAAYFKSRNGIEIKENDIVYPRATMRNSANTMVRFWVNSGLWRKVCSNGMMGPDSRFKSITSKKLHKGSLDLDKEVGKYIDSIEENMESMGLWKSFASKSLKAPDIDTIMQRLEVGPRVREELLTTTLRGDGVSPQTLLDSNKLTGWDLYNSFSQRITDSGTTESKKIEKGIMVSNAFERFVNAA